MKKTPSRPSREETREHQHRIAELDDYRQAKYDRDAPLPPAGMMSNTQILRREAAKKSTPFSAMIRMVAHEFPGRGEKTIEKIWLDYLKEHPDQSERKGKTPTIPTAERTPSH